MNKVIIKRFARGFLAGGIAAMATMLATGVQIKEFKDLQTLIIALSIAFVTGGLQAVDKFLRYEPEVSSGRS